MSIAEKFETIADAVYDKGKQAEGLAYWKAITANGRRKSSWYYAFAYTDYAEIEFVKPVVITGEHQRLFYAYHGKKLPRKQDIDLSGITSAQLFFSFLDLSYNEETKLTIPDYGIPALNYYTSTYANSNAIQTIEVIRCHEATTFSSSFAETRNLENITFEGTIGTNISFSTCKKLTVDSLKNIITHLKDYSGTENEFKYSVTFSSACLTALEALDPATDPSPNGNSWVQYLDDIGWELT